MTSAGNGIFLTPVLVKSPAPGFAGGAAFRRRKEVVERDVQERTACLGEDLVAVPQVGVDVDAPPAAVRHPGCQRELVVDEDRPPVADEDPRRHGREAVPRGEETAGLVESRGDQAAVDDPRPCLVVVAERDDRLVALDALVGRLREMEALRVVAAAPARRIVVRRNARLGFYLSPPRSK